MEPASFYPGKQDGIDDAVLSFAEKFMGAAPQPQLLLNAGLTVIFPNKAFCSLTGLTAGELSGTLVQDIDGGAWYHRSLQGLVQSAATPETLSPISYRVSHGNQRYRAHAGCMVLPGMQQPLLLLSLLAAQPEEPELPQPQMSQLAHSLFETSPDCLKLLDTGAHLLDMNKCGRKMMEVDDLGKLLGANWIFFWGENQHLALEAVASARQGVVGRFSAPCATLKGTPKWWEVIVSPVFSASGEVIQLVASSRDVTRERTIRNELRRSEELARTLFDQSPDCLKLMDLEGNIIAVNEACKKMLLKEGSTKLCWVDLWAPEHAEMVRTEMAKAVQGGIGQFTAPCTPLQGATLWWEVLVAPVCNEEGKVYRLMASCRDITTRKQLEHNLAEHAMKKELALEAARMGTWSFQFGADDMGMDERAKNMFGLSKEEKLSHTAFFSLIHPADRKELLQVIEKDKETKNALSHVEYRVVNGQEKPVWVHAYRKMFFDTEGNPSHCVGLFQDITGQKETENRLRKINQTLQLGIQVANLAILEVDYTCGQVTLSPEAARLYGLPAGTQTVTRLRLHQTFHPADRQRLNTLIQASLDPEGSGLLATDHRVVWPDGTVRWLNVRKQVFFAQTHKGRVPSYSIIAAQDITAQQETSERIRLSENRFRSIFNDAPVAIWEEDFSDGLFKLRSLQQAIGGNLTRYFAQHPNEVLAYLQAIRVIDVNEAAVRLFEARDKAELIARLPETFLPESLLTFSRELASMAGGEQMFKSEVRMQTLNGNPLWILISVRFPQGGDFSSVLVSMTDISLLKKLEAEVNAQAGRIQQILDSLPQKAWISSPEGAMEYLSSQWYEYTGLSTEASLGSGWRACVHKDDLAKAEKVFVKAFLQKAPFGLQLRICNAENNYRWHLVRGIAFCDNNGSILSWVGTCTDIHDQKMAAQLLEQAVVERTREIVAINQALQESNRELEEFVFVASHDLQEPLRKIRTFVDAMLNAGAEQLPAAQLNYLKRIDGSATRMTNLMRGLLDFAQLREVAQAEDCHLNRIVTEVLDDLDLVILEKGALVQVADLPVVRALSRRMNQLFQNLLANALKFSGPSGTPRIQISTQPLLPHQLHRCPPGTGSGSLAHIVVSDNGIGFAPQYAEKIFQIFQRLHGSGNYSGTGIGLAICRKIAVEAGGNIWAESREGEGAAFHILLPLATL